MAIEKKILHRKNALGTYDTYYLQTGSDVVMRPNDTTVEKGLTDIETRVENIESKTTYDSDIILANITKTSLNLPDNSNISDALVSLKTTKNNEVDLFKAVKITCEPLAIRTVTSDMRYSLNLTTVYEHGGFIGTLKLIDNNIDSTNITDKIVDTISIDDYTNITGIFGTYIVLARHADYWRTYKITNGKLVLASASDVGRPYSSTSIIFADRSPVDTEYRYGCYLNETIYLIKENILTGEQTSINTNISAGDNPCSIVMSGNKVVLSCFRQSDRKDRIIIYDKIKNRFGVLDVSIHFPNSQTTGTWNIRCPYCVYCDDDIAYLVADLSGDNGGYPMVAINITDIDNLSIISKKYCSVPQTHYIKVDNFFGNFINDDTSSKTRPINLSTGEYVELPVPIRNHIVSSITGYKQLLFYGVNGLAMSNNYAITWCFKKYNTWFSHNCCFCGDEISMLGRGMT